MHFYILDSIAKRGNNHENYENGLEYMYVLIYYTVRGLLIFAFPKSEQLII